MLAFIRSQGRKTACSLPLTTARRKVGVLSFGSRTATAYTDDILAFMEQVAATVAIAVDNSINYDQAQRYQRELGEERDHLRFLLDVNNLLVSHLDYRGLLKAIAEAVQRVIDADHIGVALYDEESAELRLDWIYDKARGFTRSDTVVALDESAAGLTLQRGAAGVFRRADLEGSGWAGAPLMKAQNVESLCCVPLVTRKGRYGVLFIGSASPDAFSEEDVTLLGQTSAQVAIALENARAYEQLTALNSHLIDEKQYLERELLKEFAEIIGTSAALRKVLKAVKTVASTDSTVLLLGETGTGKELIARAVHQLSPRHDRTFVRMSVAAVPSTLFESELFGHERGAFTGATASRTGRIELANRGTLFLDEVGDIPAGSAAEAAARPAGARVRAPGQHAHSEGGCPRRGGNQSRSRAHDRGRIVQERFVLSPQRLPHHDPAAAGSGRRHSRAGRTLRPAVRPAAGAAGALHSRRGDWRAQAVDLAWQHPRAAERHRAGGDPVAGSRARAPVAGYSAEGPSQRVELESARDLEARHHLLRVRTRGDSARVEGIRRRHRGADRRRCPARAAAHHPAFEDAEAGHSAADLLKPRGCAPAGTPTASARGGPGGPGRGSPSGRPAGPRR